MSAVKKNLFDTIETPSRKKPRYYEFISPRFLQSSSSPLKSDSASDNLPKTREHHSGELTKSRETILQKNLKQLGTADNVELFLVAKCGLKDAMLIFQCLNHVPERFPQYFDHVTNILVAGGVDKHFNSVDELKETVKYVCDTFSVNKFNSPVPSDILWKATNMFKTPYLGFVLTKAETCLENGCDGKLYGRKKDIVEVTVYSLQGPVPFLKATLVCRKCQSRYKADKYYSVKDGVSYFYGNDMKPDYVTASNRVLFTRDTFEMMCEAGNHGFVSAQAFAEIHASTFNESHPSTRNYIDYRANQSSEAVDPEISKPFMTNKLALEAFFNGELENELYERNQIGEVKMKQDSDREQLMRVIDDQRRDELYSHTSADCAPSCVSKGCKNLRVIDGCWKLCIPHCMMAVRTEVDGYPLLNFPDVCVAEPRPGSVFCSEHHDLLERNSIPTEKKAFLRHIGCKASPVTQTDLKRVDEKVIEFAESLEALKDETTIGVAATTYQGTYEIVKKMQPTTFSNNKTVICNKDTGEKSRLRQRSRGVFVAVSGGGNILYFNPIYKSESPSQVFMIVIRMIYLEMKDVPDAELDERLKEYILCYDNMCHLDTLMAAKEELPLPGKLKLLWQKIRKIIDRLHMTNHKDKECVKKYNPDKILPQGYNTMAAEQLFAWMSRFKKIVNSMTQTHHMFFLHRMCIRRNKYTSSCRRRGVEPVLPGINVKLNKSDT